MKIPPVTMTYHTSSEDSDERRRHRLLNTLKELMLTDPSLRRLAKKIADGESDIHSLCKTALSTLGEKNDRRSVRVRRLLLRLMEL